MIHGENGDDFIYGQAGNDVLFGDGQNDDDRRRLRRRLDLGRHRRRRHPRRRRPLFVSRNGIAEPLYGIAAIGRARTRDDLDQGGAQDVMTTSTGTLLYTAI